MNYYMRDIIMWTVESEVFIVGFQYCFIICSAFRMVNDREIITQVSAYEASIPYT